LKPIEKDARESLDNILSFNAYKNDVPILNKHYLEHTPILTQFSMYFNFGLFAGNGTKLPVKFFSCTPLLERMSRYGTSITTFDAGTFKNLTKL